MGIVPGLGWLLSGSAQGLGAEEELSQTALKLSSRKLPSVPSSGWNRE